MINTTLGDLYLDASERNAQRIANLQAEIDALRAQLADTQAPVNPLWSDKEINAYAQVVGEYYDDTNAERAARDIARKIRDSYEVELTKLRAQLAAAQAALTPN